MTWWQMTVLAFLAVPPSHALFAQSPDVARIPPDARTASMGGATAALAGNDEGRSVNPALMASARGLSVVAGYANAEMTDVAETRLGATIGRSRFGTLAIDVRHREVNDLIDDPQLASEPGLTVSDWAVRSTYALNIGKRLGLGVSAERMNSVIFGTRGAGWTYAAGAVLPLTRRFSVGTSVVRLGSPYQWTDVQGTKSSSPLGRAVVAGIALQPAESSWMSAAIVADVERGLESNSPRNVWCAGAEIRIAKALSLRGGFSRAREGGITSSYPSGGLGLAIGVVDVGLARDRIGAEVGQRTIVEARIRR
jgi:hypothetical protein